MAEFFVGTMGYGYKDWQDGVFYPAGMPARNQLAHYSSIFNAVEMDTTFYATPRHEVVQRWQQSVPADFIFCPKTPRIITHDHRLRDEAIPLMAEFLEAVAHFGENLGPILIQFPPDFTVTEEEALQAFLSQLPDAYRYTVEFRDDSWFRRATSEMLKERHIAWTSTDYLYMPKQVHATTDFIYLRLLGRHGSYKTKDRERVDSTPRVTWWRDLLAPFRDKVKAVYIFANDDYAGHSPTTANRMKAALGLPIVSTRPPQQGRLL